MFVNLVTQNNLVTLIKLFTLRQIEEYLPLRHPVLLHALGECAASQTKSELDQIDFEGCSRLVPDRCHPLQHILHKKVHDNDNADKDHLRQTVLLWLEWGNSLRAEATIGGESDETAVL